MRDFIPWALLKRHCRAEAICSPESCASAVGGWADSTSPFGVESRGWTAVGRCWSTVAAWTVCPSQRPDRSFQPSAGSMLPHDPMTPTPGDPLPWGAGVEGRMEGPRWAQLVRRGVPGACAEGDPQVCGVLTACPSAKRTGTTGIVDCCVRHSAPSSGLQGGVLGVSYGTIPVMQ